MPYFPVDDQFAFHPKAVAAGNAAVGLWTRAGSWCKAHASGGKVPHEIAHALGAKKEVERLISVGLWVAVDGGYQFHDWSDQAGNFDAEIEKQRRQAERERNRERKRRQRERERSQGHGDSHGVTPEGVTQGGPSLPSLVPSPSPSTRLNNVSHLPSTAGAGIDVDKVIVAVQKHCGRECGTTGAYLIIGTVMDRAKTQPKNRTAYVVKAIATDPFEFQKILDEAVAS